MSSVSISTAVRLQSVILATDFSDCSRAAVEYAVAIAEHYSGTVHVLHVIPPALYAFVQPEMLPEVEEGVKLWAEQQMQNLLRSRQLGSVPHDGHVRYGPIWDAFSAFIGQKQPDLIVTGTHGRRGVSKLIMGSVAEEIFRLSPVPVLTVPPSKRRSHPLRNILYATDFSPNSVRAMAYAVSLAQEYKACLIFLHVAPMNTEDPDVRQRLGIFFTEQIRQIVPAESFTPCAHKLDVEFGDPAEGILKAAAENEADLIVISVHGAGSLARASTHFGSTAYRVVSQALVPVMSVRHENATRTR